MTISLFAIVLVSITDPEDGDNEEKKNKTTSLDKRHACSRTMSTRRVCWHRNTSVSTVEYSIAVRVCFYTSIQCFTTYC